MIGTRRSRRIARRRKRAIWAAALCSASFVTGQLLFGDDQPAPAPAAPSLIKQYLEAKSDVVTPPIDNDPAATRRSKPVIIAAEKPAEAASSTEEPIKVEPIKIAQLPAEIAPAASLRPTAVSAANDLPFVRAQPLPTTAEARQANAESPSAAAPAVIQTGAAGSAVTTSAEHPEVKAGLPASLSKPADDENLPPIVPAWAVPRPGTKKKPTPPAPQNPAVIQQPSSPPSESNQNPRPEVQYPMSPALPRIELGGSLAPSPATLPQASPPPPVPTKRADTSPLQTLPQVIEMTPRVNSFQPTFAAKPPASKEPSLLPPPQAAMPMPLEIRNPHVSQASRASFEMPLAWPSTAPQHVDDVNPLR